MYTINSSSTYSCLIFKGNPCKTKLYKPTVYVLNPPCLPNYNNCPRIAFCGIADNNKQHTHVYTCA